jgi:hypothetical protein
LVNLVIEEFKIVSPRPMKVSVFNYSITEFPNYSMN